MVGYGFALYGNPELAKQAVKLLNGFDVDGLRMGAEPSREPLIPRSSAGGRVLGQTRWNSAIWDCPS